MRAFGKFRKGKVGSKAYMVSKVWKLGLHIFTTEDLIIRLCYFRNKKATYYIQFSKQIKKQLECGMK